MVKKPFCPKNLGKISFVPDLFEGETKISDDKIFQSKNVFV